MAFTENTEVLIKNPGSLIGTIVRGRPGNEDLPPEQRLYTVLVHEREKFYRGSDLAPVPDETYPLSKYSAEWGDELTRMLQAIERLKLNKEDASAMSEAMDAGTKLGFFIDRT